MVSLISAVDRLEFRRIPSGHGLLTAAIFDVLIALLAQDRSHKKKTKKTLKISYDIKRAKRHSSLKFLCQ